MTPERREELQRLADAARTAVPELLDENARLRALLEGEKPE